MFSRCGNVLEDVCIMAKHWTGDAALVDSLSRNLYEALPLLPKRLVKVDAITREFGMPFSHIQILCMLSGTEMSIGEISARLGIAKPNVTPLLDALAARGLLIRCKCEADRRIVNVRLLQEGCELAEKLRCSIASQVMGWPEGFSHSDIKRLNNALAYLIDVGKRLAEVDGSITSDK